jgi:DNA-binding protein HU-beta
LIFQQSICKGESMNKGELIDAVAGGAGLSRADATKAVDAILDSITGALSNGGSVSLVGFGTFSVKARAARAGRNAQHAPAATRGLAKPSRFRPVMCPVSRLAKP